MQLILASGSPRRKELLRQVGIEFSIEVADIDETPAPYEKPEAYVRRLAREKAAAVYVRIAARGEITEPFAALGVPVINPWL